MNTLKNQLPLFALLLGFALVFTQSAFKSGNTKTPVEYQYISNSSLEVQMQDINNWEIVDEETPSCSTGSAKPCRFIYEGDFDAFLQGTTKTHLLENAESLKQ